MSIGLIVLALATSRTMAQQFTWDGGGTDNNWTTAENWVGDVAPTSLVSDNSALIFTGAVRPTPVVDVNWSGLQSITFDAAADPFTIGNGGVGTRLMVLNTQARITNDSTNDQTLNVNILGQTPFFILDANAGNLIFNGEIDLRDIIANDGVNLGTAGASDVTINGVISGTDGQVFAEGTGTLTLNNNNTYTGTTFASAGTLVLNGSVAGDVQSQNAGTMEINDTVNGNANVIGSSNMFVKNGGAIAMDATVNGGTLTVEAGGTVTGNSTVNGDMVLDGITGGDVTVAATSVFTRFSGTGTVGGNLVVNNFGSTVAPGNSIGVMNVSGNHTQNASTVLEIEINKSTTSADLLNVTGSATFNAGSQITIVQEDTDTILEGDQFTIVQTGTGVTNNAAPFFNSPSNTLIGFDLDVVGNDLLITAVRGGNFFEGNGTSPNNTAIGRSLDSLNNLAPMISAEADAMLNTLGGLSGAPLNSAVSQLSPKTYHVAALTNVENARAAGQRTSGYLEARRRGLPVRTSLNHTRPLGPMLASAAPDPELLAYAMSAQARPPYQGYRSLDDRARAKGRWGGFAQGFGLHEQRDSRAELTGYDADAYGAQLGIDYMPWRNVIVGLSFSYINTDVDLNDGLGDSDIDTYRIGPYLSYEAEPWHFAYSLTFGVHDADNTRVMPAIPATATSDTDSWDVAFYAEGGLDYAIGEHTYLTPMGSLQYLHFEQDDFVESGGGGAALSVDSRDTKSLRTRLGAGITHTVHSSNSNVVLEGYFGWEHEFLANDGDEIVARFAAGGSPFAINVGSVNEDSLFIGGGATVLVNERVSLYVLYDGNFFSDGETHAVGGGVSVRF